MYNFIYAIDKNYNTQLYVSISSLLDKIEEKINIYVIHNEPETFDSYFKKILNKDKLNEFNIFKFESEINFNNFPSLENSHVSEATYYRFFLDEYLPEELEKVIYLDADVVCINNPIDELNKINEDLKRSDLPLASRTIGLRMRFNDLKKTTKRFDKVNIQNDRYFSAGVIIINYPHWIKNNIFSKLINLSKELGDNAELHDQDVINSLIDGNYLELSEFMNRRIGKDSNYFNNKDIYKNAIFLHYEGNWKPWTVKGILKDSSIFYTKYFRHLEDKSYHITHSRKLNSIKDMSRGVISFKFLKLDRPFRFILETLRSLY